MAEQIRAQRAVVPAQGFAIAGLGLTAARASDVRLPAVSIHEVDIGRVHGEALPLGALTLANIGLPSAAVGNVSSRGVDADASSSRTSASSRSRSRP